MKYFVFLFIFSAWSGNANAVDFRNGDMIFHTSKSSQMGAVFRATRSTFTHVGIVEVDKSGNKWVIEAVGPVRRIPLQRWIDQGVGNKYALHRKNGITPEQAAKVVAAANKYADQKLPYDKQFSFDNGKKTYCSELVEMAYRDAGLSIGKRQKLKDLSLSGAQVERLIKERWREHPACKGASVLKNCVDKVLESELITPYGLTMSTDDSSTEEIYNGFSYLDTFNATIGRPPKSGKK